jgi:hypothetical protein
MNLSHERFLAVLASLKASDGVTSEQRNDPRVGLRASVMIAPCPDARLLDGRCVDSTGKDVEPGPAFSIRVQDLSSGGIAFQHFNALAKGKLFVLDLPTGPEDGRIVSVRILARVLHCRTTAEHRYLIGAQFVRLWTTPAPSLDALHAAAA